MTIDPPRIDPLDSEQHLSYAQVGKLVPGRPSPTTVWRWMRKGKQGVKLPSIPLASGRVTTREAIRWWYAQLQQAEQQPAKPKQRRRQLDPAIVAECEAAGI